MHWYNPLVPGVISMKKHKLDTTNLPRVVIIGCGFGGLEAAKVLSHGPVDITVIDRTNHHLFQPLLYQVATAGLPAPAIAGPIRHILRKEIARGNTTVLMGEVMSIDSASKCVVLDGGEHIHFDFLILAAGATHSYFGRDDWAKYAPGLKTLGDAFTIRRRVLTAFAMGNSAAGLFAGVGAPNQLL